MLEMSSVNIFFSGSLNVEWAVRPHYKSVAAMPDEATARAVFFYRILLLLIVNLLEMLYPCLQEHLKNILPSILLFCDNIMP